MCISLILRDESRCKDSIILERENSEFARIQRLITPVAADFVVHIFDVFVDYFLKVAMSLGRQKRRWLEDNSTKSSPQCCGNA
jgi:hypothetical protein